MSDKVRVPVEPLESICPRCQRPYFLEPVNDPGVCCICHRDDQMLALYGTDWRKHIKKATLAAAQPEERGKERRRIKFSSRIYGKRKRIGDRRATKPNAAGQADTASSLGVGMPIPGPVPAAPKTGRPDDRSGSLPSNVQAAKARQARGEGEPPDVILAHPESNAAPEYAEPWTAETIYDVSEKVWTAGINWSTWGHKV